MWKRRLRYYTIKILRIKDSPRSVALGFTLGACINFIPTFGFGIVISGFLASLTRINVPASILGQLLLTPVFPLLFSLNFLVGHLFFQEQLDSVQGLFPQGMDIEEVPLADIGAVFLTGAGLNMAITALIIFLIVYKVFKSYRRELIRWYLFRNRKP